jgi:hypothetical protein
VRRPRLIASLVLTGAGIGGLVAAQLPATPLSAVVALPTVPGSAFATATVLTANPEYGSLSLVARGGQATASYTGSQAVANSQVVNLGFLGGLSTGAASGCTGGGGSTAATTPAPSPTAALNALVAVSAAGPSNTSAIGGSEAVSVNPTPESAGATTKMAPIAIPGLLTVNAQSAAHVAYASGQQQEADANSTMSVALLGGLVTLDGLTWTANQQSGSKNAATASFTMAAVTIAGKTTAIVGPTALTSTVSLVNKVLAAVGLSLTLPTQSTSSVTGAITMSPLQIQLTGTALVATVLSHLTTTQTTVEKAIAKALASFNNACLESVAGVIGTGELLASIVEGILAGGGVIDLQLGGASADTQAAPNFVDPLGGTGSDSGGTDLTPSGPSTLGIGSGVTGGLGNGFGNGAGATTAPSTSAASAATPTGHPQSLGTPVALVHCVSSSPANRPSCWSGAATVAAAVLLIAGGSLFAADFVRSRRKLTRPKETL